MSLVFFSTDGILVDGQGRWLMNGYPLLRGSGVQLATPNWEKGIYTSTGKAVSTNRLANGIRVVRQMDKSIGSITETYTLQDGVTAVLNIEYGGTDQAIVEWKLGSFDAEALEGGEIESGETRVSLDMDFKTVRGKRLKISGRFGTMVVSCATFDLLFQKNGSTYWLGVTGYPISPGGAATLEALAVIEPSAHQAAPDVSRSARFAPRVERRSSERPVLIPQPKVVNWNRGEWRSREVVIVTHDDASKPVAEQLRTFIANELNHPVRFGQKGNINLSIRREDARRFPTPDQPEAYGLNIDNDVVWLTANTLEGLRFAAQTLTQLLSRDGPMLRADCVAISDFPSLPFRGVHLLAGASADFHVRLINRLLGRLKFNHLVFECEYAQWETDPKIWVDYSMSKQDLTRVANAAANAGLEVVPLVQSLGHCEWMFKNGRNLDLAEDPETPYAYCPRNPDSRKFIESVYSEAIEIFKPKKFHIGHDEVTMRGRFPHCDRCRGATSSELFIEDTIKIREFLKGKGVETVMMWGDVLLHRSEANDGGAHAPTPEQAAKVRAQLPKDLAIMDWHYTPSEPQEYKSLKVLMDAGFQRVAATTWYEPINIYNFARAARDAKAWGLLQSTWAGFNLSEKTLRDAAQQIAAYIWAAEYAWNTDSPPPHNLSYKAEAVLRQWMDPDRAWSQEAAIGVTIDDPFERSAKEATVSMNLKALELLFVGGCLRKGEKGLPVADIELQYQDGTVETIPLIYGQNASGINDPLMVYDAPVEEGGWRGTVWRNPHPNKTISAIAIKSKASLGYTLKTIRAR